MFKLKFNEGRNVKTFNNKAVVVTLMASMNVPRWMDYVPGGAVRGVFKKSNIYVGRGKIKAVGKAVCGVNDQFNEEVGIRIAESRAKIKAYKFCYQICVAAYKSLSELVYGKKHKVNSVGLVEGRETCDGGLFEDLNKYRDLLTREEQHLSELLRQA